MAPHPHSHPKTIVVAAVSFGLFIAAIIARAFWLSLIFGIAGAMAMAYAVLLLREYRKSLPANEKDAA
jgi:hypothetical protein